MNNLPGGRCKPAKRLALSLLAVASAAAAAEWPQWRGPERTGVITESLPDRPPGNGLSLLWRADVPDGLASVAVAGGMLFTMSRDGDGGGRPANRSYILALARPGFFLPLPAGGLQ